MKNNPITTTSIILLATTIIVYIILYLIHPAFVTKTNTKGYLVRDQAKLILWSLFSGVSVSLIYFIIIFKKNVFESDKKESIIPVKKNILNNYNPSVI